MNSSKSGDAFSFNFRILNPKDGVRHVFCRGSSKRDDGGGVTALFGTVLDVTALKRAEATIEESETRFQMLAESTSDVITRLNADFRREYVSPSCTRVFGYSAEEMIGMVPSDSIHPEDAPAVRESARQLIAGEIESGRTTNTYRTKHKQGHWIWVEAGISLARESAAGLVLICSLRDVTERKHAEAAVEANERRYRILADNATDTIVLTDLGLLRTYVSPASREVFGCEPEALLGKRVLDIVHPDDQDTIVAAFAEMERGLPRAQTVHRIRHVTGEWRWVEVAYKGIVDHQTRLNTGYLLALRDVTRRVLTETKLRASEAMFRILAENTNELIIMAHEDGRRSYVSPASQRMLGFTPDEMMAMHLRDYVHPEDLPMLFAATSRLGEGQTEVSVVYRARHKTRGFIWAEGIFRRVFGVRAGEPTIVATFRDVSDRIAQSEALRAAKIMAEKAQAAAETASRAKTDFLASMSHEIRTPLHGILGYTDLLLAGGALTPLQRRNLDRIQSSGTALLTVVNDILDFSKIEAGQVDLDPRPFQLGALVDNTISIVGGLADAKGLKLKTAIQSGLPGTLVGDEDRLRQILLNLLNNAIKFTQTGWVKLSITGELVGNRVNLSFAVEDTGIGIPEEKRSRLFRRFSQVDGSVSREFGGTGLGLAISKSLIEKMGGTIGVDTAPAGGTIFWLEVTLPKAEGQLMALSTEPVRLMTRPCHVLLVEDLEINQDLARAVIEAAGHTVDIVSDGADAVMAVQANAYDVVLMDVQMPGMDGMTATRAIRALPSPAAGVSIVAMTANVLPAQVAQFKMAGMNDHVGKPFKRAELQAVIARWSHSDTIPIASDSRPEIEEDKHAEMVELLGVQNVERILGELLKQLDERFADERLVSTDRVRIAADAHTMVSAFGMLGFTAFSGLCVKVEDICLSSEPIDDLIEELKVARRLVASAILSRRLAA